MSARPWMKFFTGDWRSDTALRACSLAARGLWFEMLCIMHDASPRGHLLVAKSPPSRAQLASMSGTDVKTCGRLLEELERAGVFSLDGEIIVCRRMVREAAKAAADKANGKLGGNPALKPGVNPRGNPYKLEARSQSQKEEREKTESPRESRAPGASALSVLSEVLDVERARAVVDHRAKLRKPLTVHAARLLAGKFAQCPDPNAAADAMVGNGWQGFNADWLQPRAPPNGNGHAKPTMADIWRASQEAVAEHERKQDAEPRLLDFKQN